MTDEVQKGVKARLFGSLSYRIVGALCGLLVVVSGVVTTVTYVSIRKDAFREKQALVDVMSYTLETTLADAPSATLQRVVENCSTIAGIESIEILDRKGIALASSDRLQIGQASSSHLVTEFLHAPVLSRASHVADDSFVIMEPLRGRGALGGSQRDIVAFAVINMRLLPIEEAAQARAKEVLGASIAGYVILCAALAFVLRVWVTRPLSALADAAARLQNDKRTSSRPFMARDEVDQLTQAFEDMRSRIDVMVSGLEAEVATRTSDLRAERQALQREKDLVQLLFEVTMTANEARDIEGALSDALEHVCRVTGWPAARMLMAKTAPGARTQFVETSILFPREGFSWPDTKLDEEGSQISYVASRAGVLATPVIGARRAAFPVLVGAEVVGVMEFLLGAGQHADERLVAAMRTVGTEIGRVIERGEVERLKDEFVSTVSHELRTPLTAIRGSLGLLHGGVFGPLPEQAEELVSIAKESCDRLVRLINDLLDMQKLEAGKVALDIQTVSLAPLLAQVIAANRSLSTASGVTMKLDVGELYVMIDPDRLVQIVTNLVSNAIKFSPNGSEVLVRAMAVGERIKIEVADRGPGIPEAFRERIFGRFMQADGSTTRHKAGSGLGLGIAKSLVELHGGKIGFLDREGGGTIFYFELPASEAPIGPERSSMQSPAFLG